MQSINLNLNSTEVKSKVRKLRTKWSYDVIVDLNNKNGFYGLDEKMAKELNRAFRRESRQKMIENIFFNQKP